jgi:hypothetical protein
MKNNKTDRFKNFSFKMDVSAYEKIVIEIIYCRILKVLTPTSAKRPFPLSFLKERGKPELVEGGSESV